MTHAPPTPTIRPFRDRHPAGRPRRPARAARRRPAGPTSCRATATTAIAQSYVALARRPLAHRYDWRAVEARLNAFPQFTTEIDGQNVHFLHVRSPEPDALPLIVTHGWPGSIVEFLDVDRSADRSAGPRRRPGRGVPPGRPVAARVRLLGPDPRARAGTTARIAAAWVELMRRLGYERYGAVGNDAGSMISPESAGSTPSTSSASTSRRSSRSRRATRRSSPT